MPQERLQKILAHAGLASRRAAEALITAGKVRVNGKIVSELGASADPRKDKIEVDGKRIVLEKPLYYVLHKPRGMVTTLSDPEGRPHLGEVLGKMPARVYPIGRLDFHTSGVLLVTNDGELTEALLHPRKEVPKTYVAKMRGSVGIEALDLLRNGVVLDDGHKTKKADVFVLREEERCTWVQLTLYEGKNRQIHRMGEAVGHPVLRLVRMQFAGIDAEGLRPGEWRAMTDRELEKLKKTYVTPLRQSKDAAPGKPKHGGPRPDAPSAKGAPRSAAGSQRSASGARSAGTPQRSATGTQRSATGAPQRGAAGPQRGATGTQRKAKKNERSPQRLTSTKRPL
jgi:23S rRNA pseudouridine2605 synthase